MRVVHTNCFRAPEALAPRAVLDRWFTLRRVTAALVQAGLGVTIVQAASHAATDEVDGVRVEFVPEARESRARRRLGPWLSPVRRGIVRRVAELAPDAVHVHGLAHTGHAAAIASRARAPVLMQHHAEAVPRSGLRWLARRAFRSVAGVAFTSRDLARPFFRSRVFPPQLPVHEVVEGSSWFRPGDQRAARVTTGLFGDPCLVWVARLSAGKDPLAVLDALAMAGEQLGDWRLWCFYQDAPLLDQVRARVRDDARLAGRVMLRGAIPHAEVEQVLRAADFLVTGSHSESCGFAVVEALACGTPPIGTDIPALRRLTDGGTVGALSRPGDAEAMARNLVAWFRRERHALRAAARQYFERELSYQAIGRQLCRAYESMVAAQPGTRR